MMIKPAIVAIGYNRPESLKRLLDSVERASFPEDVHPTLIISIDKSDSDAAKAVADDFVYSHGEKTVIARSERMGLRAHVLSCGDLTEEYGSVIILEDDLLVSPRFYEYACAALDHSEKDDRIGTVSLYNHLFNVHAREAFCALDDGYDDWYLQMASSWGQAYTKKQWRSFRSWYEVNKERPLAGPFVPQNVSGWSDRSWLKYYIVYLIETGKYSMYPRVSLTTNFGDVGTHSDKPDTDLQVPVQSGNADRAYVFAGIDRSAAVYDAFFESVKLNDISRDNALIDLYGTKPLESQLLAAAADGRHIRYILSCRRLPYAVIRSFGRQMRPVDANIIYNVAGNDLFLYDIKKSAKEPEGRPAAVRLLYQYRGISAKQMLKIIWYRLRYR